MGPNTPHQYSEETFRTVMSLIQSLSAFRPLRMIMQQDEENFLHLRGLASGSIRGLTANRQQLAQQCLRHFITDNICDKTLGAPLMKSTNLACTTQSDCNPNRPANINDVMIRYFKGHLHALYCDGLALEGAPEDGMTAAIPGCRRMRRSCKVGFADETELELLNRKAKKRTLKLSTH